MGKLKNLISSKRIGLYRFVVCFFTLMFIAGTNLCIVQTIQAEEITHSPYFSTEEMTLSDGGIIEKSIINGPPKPPVGFIRTTVSLLPETDVAAGVNTMSDVPAFSWSFGCSATSAAMVAGYYDRNGYANMYTGPANAGIMPLNNDAYWSTWTDSYGDSRNRCPLSATQNGLDGRTQRGHVGDYWIGYGDTGPDPFVVNGWTEHIKGDCTADFMGTNQASSPIGNSDGGTAFWNYKDGRKLSAEDLYNGGYHESSGLYGVQEFYESRGYTVIEAYNQYIYPYGSNTQGFTYQQYKDEIDAGRPVMFHVEGHTMVGIGYDDSSNLMYIHDTWDHSQHTMTWGGSYSGMQQYAVTIVKIESNNGSTPAITNPADGSTLTGSSQAFSWSANGASPTKWWIYAGTAPGNSDYYSSGSLSSSTTSTTVTGLPTDGSTVYVRLYYYISGSWEYSDTSYTASSNGDTPAITSPADGSTFSDTNVTFNWSANGASVSGYYLYVGTSGVGSSDLFKQSMAMATTVTVSGLPSDGSTVYVRLWYNEGGSWQNQDYTYTAYNGGEGAGPAITSPAPGSTLTGASQTFSWTAAGESVSQFYFWVGTSAGSYDILLKDMDTATSDSISGLPTDGTTVYVRFWYYIGTKPAAVQDNEAKAVQAGTWYYEDYSYTASSSSGDGFNSQFNNNASGWYWLGSDSDLWTLKNNAYFYTAGQSEKYTNTYYGSYSDNSTMYDNYDYQVKLWRTGSDSNSSCLWFRGSPYPQSSCNGWDSGYSFNYTKGGEYSIWMRTNGEETNLKSWTSSSSINQGSVWNTLRVLASGTTVYFYINGNHIATLTNASYTNGKVGFGMYSDGTSGNGLYADSATLTPSSASKDLNLREDAFVIDASDVSLKVAGNSNSSDAEAIDVEAFKAGSYASEELSFIEALNNGAKVQQDDSIDPNGPGIPEYPFEQ